MQAHPFHEFPKHLYHASKLPRVIHNAAEEKLAREGDPKIPGEDGGYTDDYVHHDYPKAVTIGKDKDGNPIQATAKTPEEEAALLAR